MKLDQRDSARAAWRAAMTHEACAGAPEHYMMAAAATPAAVRQGSPASAPASMAASRAADKRPFPSAVILEAQIETSSRRRGVGYLFTSAEGHVKRLAPMPAKPRRVATRDTMCSEFDLERSD